MRSMFISHRHTEHILDKNLKATRVVLSRINVNCITEAVLGMCTVLQAVSKLVDIGLQFQQLHKEKERHCIYLENIGKAPLPLWLSGGGNWSYH